MTTEGHCSLVLVCVCLCVCVCVCVCVRVCVRVYVSCGGWQEANACQVVSGTNHVAMNE